VTHVGGQTAQILAGHFGPLDALINADRTELEQIDQVGPKMAESIYDYFHNEKNLAVINQFLDAGVKPQPPQQGAAKQGPLVGKTVVVTGMLKNYTRQSIKEAIVAAGGKPSSSVSKNTDLVLAGESPGSKLAKAEHLGVKVISEEQFEEML
jgi:DNA ligase (NAD+)